MRFKVSFVLVLFLLTAPVCAADQVQRVVVTLRIHATGTTTWAYNYHYENNWSSVDKHSNDTFSWFVDTHETWAASLSTEPFYAIFLDRSGYMTHGGGGQGNGAASESGHAIHVVGCYGADTPQDSQSQATWGYSNVPYPFPLMNSGVTFMPTFTAGSALQFMIFPTIQYAAGVATVTKGDGSTKYTDGCNGTKTTSWDTWDYYAKAGGFAHEDWGAAVSDRKFQALWSGTFDQSSVSRSESFTFPHDDATGRGSTRIDVTMTLSVGLTPPPPPPVKDDDCRCKESGSIIGAQDQSLGQVVPIAGTPFALRYQSDRLPGRLGDIATWTAKKLALGGWSLNVHHAYDPNAGVLYLGSGERRSGNSVHPVPTADGGFLIPGEDENLIYQFDPTGNHTRTLDEFTGTALYEFVYDGQGRLTGIKDDAGNQTSIERNGDQPTAIVGPFGHRATLTTDANGYLAEIQAPDGAVTALAYDAKGLLSTLTDPRGNAHNFTFDGAGRLTLDAGPEGDFQTLTRMGVDSGYAVQRTTSEGLNTVYKVLNPSANPAFQTQLPDGSSIAGSKAGPFFNNFTEATGMATTVDYAEDPRWGLQAALPKSFSAATPGGLAGSGTLDRAVTLSDALNPLSLSGLLDTMQVNGRTYRTEYAATNRTLTDTSPAGRQIVTTLDAHGRTVAWQRNGLAPSQYTYDSHGRLSTVTAGDGNQQRMRSYEYGADGLLSRFTDALGQVTAFERDKAGRVLRRTLPDKGVVAFAYDASGNMTSITPPGRPAHSFLFTPVDLPSFYIPPMVTGSGMPTSLLWNSEKELWQVTRSDGGVVHRNFDAMGRVASMDFPTGRLSYAYDAKTGQRTQVRDADGNALSYSYDGDLLLGTTWSGAVSGQVQRTYDSDFRLASVAVNGLNPVGLGYDDDGYVVSAGDMTLTRDVTTGLISGTSLDKITDSLTYNAFGEVTQYAATGPGGAVIAVKYTRDKLGRITDISETVGGAATAWHYGYDAAGRLVSVDKGGAAFARYTYDSNGNRTRVTASGANEDATYDDQDRLTQRGTAAYQYAASGELAQKTVAGQKTQYEYDALGNLRRVLLASGKEIRYTVDGENRRTGKTVNGALAKGFLYLDSLRPAAELDGAGKVVSLFVYGEDAGAPLYLVKGGVKYRILADHLGSPRLVVNTTSGEIVQRIDYDAFGKVTADTNPGFQPFGFAGGLYDPDSGLVRFGARDYDAEVGRWMAKDLLQFGGGDTNLYAYVGNDPVNRTDRRGADEALEPLAPLVPLVPEPLAPLVPLTPKPPKRTKPKVPCKKIIWVKKGTDPWMPWYVTPTSAWPANPMGPE